MEVTVTLPVCLVLLYQQMLPVLVLLMAAGRVTHLNVSVNHARKYLSILSRKLILSKDQWYLMMSSPWTVLLVTKLVQTAHLSVLPIRCDLTVNKSVSKFSF